MLNTIPEGVTWRNKNGRPIENIYIAPQYPPLTINAIESSNFFNPERNNPTQSNTSQSRKIIGHLRARPPKTMNRRINLKTNTNIQLLKKSRQLQIQKKARTKLAKSLRNERGRRGIMGRSSGKK